MNVLAIDTTGKIGSVCILKNDQKLFEKVMLEPMNHLKFLAPLIDEAIKKSQLQINDIHLIAVSRGPGSFIGIRIGVVTARAIGQSLGIPIVAVPTLKSYIFNREEPGEICCPVFDARRNQVYGAAYFKEKELVSEACYMIDEYLDILYNAVNDGNFSGKVNFYGDALKFKEFIEEKFSSREFENNDLKKNSNTGSDSVRDFKIKVSANDFKNSKKSVYEIVEGEASGTKAFSIARLGLAMFEQGNAKEYNLILPEYLRKTEAERKLEERCPQ